MTAEKDILAQYISEEFGYDGDIDVDADLLEQQILDSFSIVQVAMFINERFELDLEADDLVREHFATLNAMLALIEKKKQEISDS